MKDQINNTDYFRESLSFLERQIYDLFVIQNERKPSNMWELMCWNVNRPVNQGISQTLLGFDL